MNDFLSKPVRGEISRYTDGVSEQGNPADFLAALDAVLALDGVAAVRWEQYTPYFNDGEACVFGVGSELEVKLNVGHDLETEDESGEWLQAWDLTSYPNGYNGGRQYKKIDGVNVPALYEALKNVSFKEHVVVLNEKFGDPAQVTYDGNEFTVDYYDHE